MLPGARRESSLDAAVIDALYGLEPVFEPARTAGDVPGSPDADAPDPGDATAVAQLQCPYCGEPFKTMLDLSAGSASYIEDCPVCCQPIEFDLVVGSGGELDALELRRSD